MEFYSIVKTAHIQQGKLFYFSLVNNKNLLGLSGNQKGKINF